MIMFYLLCIVRFEQNGTCKPDLYIVAMYRILAEQAFYLAGTIHHLLSRQGCLSNLQVEDLNL